MKIISFIIENYKAIRGRKEFNPDGGNFILIGPNGKGKTSAGRALMDILTNNVPSKPVTDGEQSGYVEYTFDDGKKLLAKLSENGSTKLELLSPEGLKIATPKDVIKRLTGTGMDFNIDNFMSLAPKPRRELLEKIAGIDLTVFNNLEKEYEEDRRIANAEAKAAAARVKPYDKVLADLDIVDTNEAVAKLKEMTEANAAIARVEAGLEQRKDKVLNIQAQIAALQAEEETIANDIHKGLDWLKVNTAHTDEEIEAQENLINKADQIKEAKRAKEDADKYELLTAHAKEIDTKIKELRADKDEAIKQVKLPAYGLVFDTDSDGLLLDGYPFESNQIAASRKLIAAIQIAASMLGDIKYLHFDGAALDRHSADEILSWAEANDLQLCLERPLWDGDGDLKMELIEPVDTLLDEPAKKSINKKGVKVDTKVDTPAPVIDKEDVPVDKKVETTKDKVKPQGLPW